MSGGGLAALYGTPVVDFGLYSLNPDIGQFDPIPFQVDERFTKVFDAGEPLEFSETIYDILGEDDGLLDAEDEVVFMFGDAGPQAPLQGEWVSGADPLRFEVAVDDPRSSGAAPRRWVYLFTGSGLSTSPTSYVTWDGLPTSSITTNTFRLDFTGNWTMTGLTVFPPCGSGLDLLDRWKGRGEPLVDLTQDEEDWSNASSYLGGIAGPIRSIRYVRRARSGVNTILHDVVSRKSWIHHTNIRVHEMVAVWVYFDWLPENGSTLYTVNDPLGIAVDGEPDPGVSSSFTDWHLMSTPSGGAFVAFDVQTLPLHAQREMFYMDDASHDDIVGGKSTYSDDDDSAYGAHGVKITDLLDSNFTPIKLRSELVPL